MNINRRQFLGLSGALILAPKFLPPVKKKEPDKPAKRCDNNFIVCNECGEHYPPAAA